MSIKLTDIGSGYNISKINSNFENLETYINSNVLHRANSNVAGEAMMQRDLDMNGHTILNAELDGSSITNDRAVRVPVGEGSIPPLPEADERKGKILTFDVNSGYPVTIAPSSGSAVDVLNQLAGENGGTLVGYRNPASAKLETVKDALDKLNLRIIYASDFGVKVDGSDNAAALFALGQEISTATTPIHVIFPRGTSLVGSQEFAGATGQGYSYRPSYFSFPWGDASDRGWFSVHRTNNQITLDMTGWTLKMNAGMKLGSFNPTTGASYTPPSLPFYNYDYQASQGFLIKIYQAPNVKIIGGTTDGNLTNAIWGGNFGDTGYQVPAYNLWLNQSSGMLMEDHIAQNSPLDGLYIGETDAISPTVGNQVKGSKFRRLLIQDCGRNCISYTGGGNATFEDIEVWRAGNNATGITGHGSGPASCLDVESEGGNIFNLRFIRCKFMYGDQYGVVGGFPIPNDITDVFFIECIIHSEAGNYAFVNYARNVNVIDSVIYGAVSLDTTTRQEPTAITGTKFYNRIDGRYITNFSISGITNKFNNNTVSIEIPTTPLPASPIFNLSGFQPLPGGYGNRAKTNNLLVLISGNSNNVTHTDLGSLAYYNGVTCHVDAGGLTGSKNLALNLQNCSLGYEGASASGSNLINFGGVMQNQVGTGIYYDNSLPVRTGGIIAPYSASTIRIGSRANAFTHGWFNDGILTKSPDGTTYRLRVNNGGAVVAIIDNSTP